MKKYFLLVSIFCLVVASAIYSSRSPLVMAADDADYDLSGVNDKIPTEAEYQMLEEVPDGLNKTGFSCDDFYRFGSIGSEIKPEKDNYKAGDEIVFRGTIENKNDYPIVNGGLYVQILRNNKTGVLLNGDHIIDEFFVKEDLSLKPSEKRDMEFKWNVPANSIEGEYTVATFFVVDKKFNLSGLSFWNHTYAGFSNFSVSGEKDGVFFDRNKVSINSKAFELRSTFEPFATSTPIEIKVPLQNKLTKSANIKLKYTLYYWDSLQKENILEEKTEDVLLKANTSKEVVYKILNPERSVYYLNLVAEGDGFRSVINIRPITYGSQARINFSGISKFPVSKGDNIESFVCFHNTSFGGSPNGRVEQTIKDREGNIVDKLEYSGSIGGGEIEAFKKDVAIQGDYDYLIVESKIFDEAGKMIEQSNLVYDCKNFGDDYCPAREPVSVESGGTLADWLKQNKAIVGFTTLIALLAVIIVVMVKRNKKISPTMMIVFVAIASISFFAFKSQMTLSYIVTDPTAGADMFPFRSRIWTSVVYDINLRQAGANLTNNQTLASGNNLNFSFAQNGEWAREGGGMDTPPVSWNTWSGAGCSNYWFSNGSCQNQGWWGFVRCNSPTTRRVVKVSGPVTCYGTYCTVDGYTTPGNPIVVRTEISQTNCATRIYARGTGSNSGSCAYSCSSTIGGNTSICSVSGALCTSANYQSCVCNDRAAGTGNCPERNTCRLFEERAYANFVPANAVNWTFYYPAPNNAQAVSCSIPAQVKAGTSFNASITMNNNGGTTWTNAGNYKLGSQNAANNTTWGVSRVLMGAASSIAPGANYIFSGTFTAPATVGTYPFSWQMLIESVAWFGAINTCSPNTSISVIPDCSSISFSSGSVSPTSIPTGGSYTLKCNYGTNTNAIRPIVGSGSCVFSSFSGNDAIYNCTAGSTPGTFDNSCSVVNEAPEKICPQTNPINTLEVHTPVPGASAGSCVVSDTIVTGQPFSVSIIMTNTGETDWDTTNYRLASTNSAWSPQYIALPNLVRPGESVTFNATITAPSTPGSQSFGWRMQRNGVGFGATNDCGMGTVNVVTPRFSLSADSDPIVYIDSNQADDIVKKSSTIKITVTPDTGFNNSITFTAGDSVPLVVGMDPRFVTSPLSVTAPAPKKISFYVNVPNSTTPGTKKIIITGTSGTVVETIDVFLKVIDSQYENR